MRSEVGSRGVNALVGFVVGIASGLIGLGGAEPQLPYIVGVLSLTLHRAVPINLSVSMFTVLAAIPTCLVALSGIDLGPFWAETFATALGAIVADYIDQGDSADCLSVPHPLPCSDFSS